MTAIYRLLRNRRQPPITPELVALIGQECTIDDSETRRQFDWQPPVSRSQGVAAIAAA